MTGNSLSQEELDILMNDNTNKNNILTSEEKDALGEIGNISISSSATVLSELLRNKTEITTPRVKVTSIKELENEFDEQYVSIKVTYTAGLNGENLLFINSQDAAIIANLMMGGDGTNVDSENIGEMELSAVKEAMNQMMGNSATSMSTMFGRKVDISPPETKVSDIKKEDIPDEPIVKIAFQLTVGELINSEIMMLLQVDFAKELVEELLLLKNKEDNYELKFKEEKQQSQNAEAKHVEQPKKISVQTPVQVASFSEFETNPSGHSENNLDLLYNIPLKVSVELGQTKKSIKEILQMSNGTIVELDRLAGEHVDILVNDKLIAKGEVVVIEENFGVRVTDIINPRDRITKIR